MQSERIKQLKKFLQEDPNDPFLLYALAIEYVEADPDLALVYFQKLLEQHPEYVPTYYHAAALYAELGKTDEAKSTYQIGIKAAQEAGDPHALRELQTAYLNWQFEQEDE